MPDLLVACGYPWGKENRHRSGMEEPPTPPSLYISSSLCSMLLAVTPNC